MRHHKFLAAAVAGMTLAASHAFADAPAGYVTATYTGVIDTIYDGGSFTNGEAITYSVTFDPADLKDMTATANAGLKADGFSLSYASVLTASLSDDPNASMTITVGDYVFDKYDQAHYGKPTSDTKMDLGVGNFPVVEYLNGAFAGIGGVFANDEGAGLYTDPIGAALGNFDGHSFYITDDTSDAEGDYDPRTTVFAAAAPEPGTWALMASGIGLLGLALRRKHVLESFA